MTSNRRSVNESKLVQGSWRSVPNRMPDRIVRFTDDFFDDLERQLPAERSSGGVPSVSDFLIYDLPPLRDLAADFVENTLPIKGVDSMQVLLQASSLVRHVAIYATDLGHDVVVFAIELELHSSKGEEFE